MRLIRRTSLLTALSLLTSAATAHGATTPPRRTLACLLLTILVGGVPIFAEAAISLGSGFFITTDGYFVTGYHVVEKATAVKIRDSKGATLDAAIAAKDVVNDLALLKVIGTFEAVPIINSRATRPGARVVTMGFPLPDIQGREPKLTDGIVNSVTGVDNNPTLFQISVSLQAGNSGGPLVNGSGNVIGVVIAKLSSLEVLKRTGDLPQNVNYAIKSNYLLELLSTVDGLDARLAKPGTQPFQDFEQLGAFLSRAVGHVIADTPDTPVTEPPITELKKATTTFPRRWKSLTTGSEMTIRLDEPYLQWIQVANPANPNWLSGQGEANRLVPSSALFTGLGHVTIRNVITHQRCTGQISYTFSLVTPGRIEGHSSGPARVDWGSCAEQGVSQSDFVWVPLVE